MHDLLGDPPSPLHRDLVAFLDWLAGLRRDGEATTRAEDVNLMEVWRLAPRIEIADVLRYADGSFRYRWRYAGSAVREAWGGETTGRFLEETDTPASVREISQAYGEIIETGQPHYARRTVTSAQEDRSFLTYQRVAAPLAGADGDEITQIILCTVFEPLRR